MTGGWWQFAFAVLVGLAAFLLAVFVATLLLGLRRAVRRSRAKRARMRQQGPQSP